VKLAKWFKVNTRSSSDSAAASRHGATILTPFLAVALFRFDGIRGVLSLMIGFLVVQIVVVLRFGIEPKKTASRGRGTGLKCRAVLEELP